MAIGQGSLFAGLSYLGIGRETTLGTAVTASANLDFLSCSLKLKKELKTLEQIETSRVNAKAISLSRTVEGDIEFYYSPVVDSCNFILQNAMGGTITSATATGDTVGAAVIQHIFAIGNMDQSYTSLSINLRKGDSASAKRFGYNGARVDELKFKAEIDDALMVTASLVCLDATTSVTDVASLLTASALNPLIFSAGRLSVEGTFASLTSTSFWHVQSVEFGWKNNLKSGKESRRIGTDTLGILPAGMCEYNLKAKMRFDTTTAYDAMVAQTQYAAQLEFLGDTLTGSKLRQRLTFNMPKVYIEDAGDPEISGPDNILTSDVIFRVLRDDSSATGYAMVAQVVNLKANYS